MSVGQPTIAVLDDEERMRKALGRLLRLNGFFVETYTLGGEMLDAFSVRPPDCLLLDLHMPGMTGFDVLSVLAALQPELPIIVMTGHDAPRTEERVIGMGAVGYLTKPIDETTLLDAIMRAISGISDKTRHSPPDG